MHACQKESGSGFTIVINMCISSASDVDVDYRVSRKFIDLVATGYFLSVVLYMGCYYDYST